MRIAIGALLLALAIGLPASGQAQPSGSALAGRGVGGGQLAPRAAIPPEQMAILRACRTDLRSLCSGVQPGEGRIGQCMRQNWTSLSAGCRTAVQARRAGSQAPSSATPAPPPAG